MKSKRFFLITILLLIIGFGLFFIYGNSKKSRDIEKFVEGNVNNVIIDYPAQITSLNAKIKDLNRTPIGSIELSDDRQYLATDTISPETNDYNDIQTYLFDIREGTLTEINGTIASWSGSSLWVTNYETKVATWYNLENRILEVITNFPIGNEGYYTYIVSPDEQKTAVSGNGVSIIERDGTISKISEIESAYVWTSDNTTLYGTIPNPEREIIPEEEYYGPLDNLLVKYNLDNRQTVIIDSVDVDSPQDLSWLEQDIQLLVNSGFDDASFDQVYDIENQIITDIGETSGALSGRYLDEKNQELVLIGEFFPEDFDYNTNPVFTNELRVYGKNAILDYQKIFENNLEFIFFSIEQVNNTFWILARNQSTETYGLMKLDRDNGSLVMTSLQDDQNFQFAFLNNTTVIIQRNTEFEIFDTKKIQ